MLLMACITTAQARETGLVLLREGVGPRAAAMGEAYTAVVGDQTAAFWNPAGIALLRKKDFLLAHHQSFQGIGQTYGGWAYGNGRRGLALSLGVHSAGGLETRTGPSTDPLGTFSVYELNGGFSYAQRITDQVTFGWSVRALQETVGPESAWGIGVDLGAMYTSSFPGLTLGAAYRNLGRMEPLDQVRTPLPRTFRAGAAYVRGPVTGSADYRLPKGGSPGIHLGAEYAIRQVLFLRGGYRSGHDTKDVSFGLGLRRRNWRIEYAFVPSALDLGGSHRVAVGIR